MDGLSAGDQGQPVGMDHDAGHGCRQNGVAVELLGLAEGDHHRQEVEHGVCEEVDDVVGLRLVVDELEHHQQGHQGLQHTGAGQGGNDGLEGAGDEVNDGGDHALLGLIFF